MWGFVKMAISLNMLCSSATAYKVAEMDEDRNPIYSEGVELTRIYTRYNTAESNGARGKEPASAATLFYDVQNSRPLGYIFEKGQKIEIDGESYTILKIAPYYNNSGLKHFEIELI